MGSVDDVPAQVENVMRVLHEAALPFCQHWQSLLAIDAELNDRSPDSTSYHHPPSATRFPLAIVIAKLVERPDFDQLAASYLKKTTLEEWGGCCRPAYEALVEYLRGVEPWSGIPDAIRAAQVQHLGSIPDISGTALDVGIRGTPGQTLATGVRTPSGNGGDHGFRPGDPVPNGGWRNHMNYDDASWHYGGDFPRDLPQETEATHIGMFLAWALLSGWGGEIHAPEALQKLRSRSVTPGAFFMSECDGKLTAEDLNDEGNAFAFEYYPPETGQFVTDYDAALGGALPDLYHVADSWVNFDKIKLVLDRRFQEWKEARA
jgi:hypothetical protein